MRVKALLRIEVLAEGWHEIPLRLRQAAIISATIGGQPARIVSSDDAGHRLLVEKKGEGLERIELALEYARAFETSPGRNSVAFDAPQAPVNRWRVRIPEPGVEVGIQPFIAASEVPPGDFAASQPSETVVLAFVGAAPQVRIDWTPRAEGATGLSALVTVQAVQLVRVDEGVMRTHTTLRYDISRAALGQLVLEVPADQKVVNVFDANVRQWAVELAGGVQRITVDLFEQARGKQELIVELERFTGDDPREELGVPVVRGMDVGRQQGLVAVGVAAGLRLDATRRTALLQVDAGEIAGSAAAEVPWALSYRYVTLPFDLAFRVEKIRPRITVDVLVEASLEPEYLSLDVQAVCDVQKAGVFQLEIEIPGGFELRHLRGQAIGDVPAAVIEGHTRAADDQNRIAISLGRKALGRVGLGFNLHRRLDEPDLLTPTGKAAEVVIRLPRFVDGAVDQVTGRLMVYAVESLRVSPGQSEGLRGVSETEALANIPVNAGRRSATQGGGLAFAFAGEPASLTLKAQRRRPHITVGQLLVARIESGVVEYEATFFYDVKYSGVRTLRIDVPEHLAGLIQNDTPGVREAPLDTPLPAPAMGYIAWGLRGDRVFKGEQTIKLTWETEIDALEVGRSAEIAVPHLRPRGADRAWGQIALAKAETIDIRATGGVDAAAPVGLRPIDPQYDLMAGAEALQKQGMARAFEFHDEWTLAVTATRYELEEVKRTSIERAVIRMVVTRSGQVAAQAIYRVRSAQQRLALELPDGVEFDTDPVRIDGRPVALERGQQREFYVPLVGQDPDRPFALEVRYAVPQGGTRLACPVFPSRPAVQKVYLCAYLPPEWVLLGQRGPWTSEQYWRWSDVGGYEPVARRSGVDLVAWATEEVSVVGNPAETFQTDGRLYVFSTLRPAPPPGGVLRLVTLNENWLNGIVFAAVILGGVLLLRTRAATRTLVIGALLAALVLCGVFLPTFSKQIINWTLATAAVHRCVGLGRVVRRLGRGRDDPLLAARREARLRGQLAPAFTKPRTESPTPKEPAAPADTQASEDAGDMEEGGRGRCRRQMTARIGLVALMLACGALIVQANDDGTLSPEVVREIHVPFEDLKVLLDGQLERVLLSRGEYEALLREARRRPNEAAPHNALIVAAEYTLQGEFRAGHDQRHACG